MIVVMGDLTIQRPMTPLSCLFGYDTFRCHNQRGLETATFSLATRLNAKNCLAGLEPVVDASLGEPTLIPGHASCMQAAALV